MHRNLTLTHTQELCDIRTGIVKPKPQREKLGGRQVLDPNPFPPTRPTRRLCLPGERARPQPLESDTANVGKDGEAGPAGWGAPKGELRYRRRGNPNPNPNSTPIELRYRRQRGPPLAISPPPLRLPVSHDFCHPYTNPYLPLCHSNLCHLTNLIQ